MNQLGGLARRMPRTSVVWLISVGSMMGVPFMSGFASKWLLYTAALQAGQVVPALLAWVVSVGTVFSCVKATSSVFLGPTTPRTENAHEAPPTMVWALGLFALGSVVLGLAPQLAVHYIINPILPLLGLATVQVSWFGLTPTAGSWLTTGGLVLAVVSAGVGVVLYLMAGMSRARALSVEGGAIMAGATGGGGVGVFTGGESISGPTRLPASEFSVILKKTWAPFFRNTDVDRVYLALWSGLQAASNALGRVMAWAEKSAITWTIALTLRWFGWCAGSRLRLEHRRWRVERLRQPNRFPCCWVRVAPLRLSRYWWLPACRRRGDLWSRCWRGQDSLPWLPHGLRSRSRGWLCWSLPRCWLWCWCGGRVRDARRGSTPSWSRSPR